MTPETKAKVLADLGEAELRRAHIAALKGKGNFSIDEVRAERQRRDDAEEGRRLLAEDADEQQAIRDAQEAKATKLRNVNASAAMIRKILGQAKELQDLVRSTGIKHAAMQAAFSELSTQLTATFNRAADGDLTGMAISSAAKDLLIWHGMGAGLPQREEPTVTLAAEQITGNFMGQLRRYARDHDLTFTE